MSVLNQVILIKPLPFLQQLCYWLWFLDRARDARTKVSHLGAGADATCSQDIFPQVHLSLSQADEDRLPLTNS